MQKKYINMEIQTKFNVGDEIYSIDKREMRIKKFEIGTIIMICGSENSISYREKGCNAFDDDFPEERCFSSKEELLRYINRPMN